MSIENITFIDVETVSNHPGLDELDIESGNLFLKKFGIRIEENLKSDDMDGRSMEFGNESGKFYRQNAALYAEFSKVVCVSIGKIKGGKLFIRSICSRDETFILKGLAESLEKSVILCAHNGKEFDFPFLQRRYMINGIPTPPLLNTIGLKPWETKLEDTMVMWSGTAWNYRVSLELLCHVLNVESPKKALDGSGVHEIYHGMFEVKDSVELPFDKEQVALDKIAEYCNGDVLALTKCYTRMRGFKMHESVEYLKYAPQPATGPAQ